MIHDAGRLLRSRGRTWIRRSIRPPTRRCRVARVHQRRWLDRGAATTRAQPSVRDRPNRPARGTRRAHRDRASAPAGTGASQCLGRSRPPAPPVPRPTLPILCARVARWPANPQATPKSFGVGMRSRIRSSSSTVTRGIPALWQCASTARTTMPRTKAGMRLIRSRASGSQASARSSAARVVGTSALFMARCRAGFPRSPGMGDMSTASRGAWIISRDGSWNLPGRALPRQGRSCPDDQIDRSPGVRFRLLCPLGRPCGRRRARG